METLFKSESGKKRIIDLYNQKLDALKIEASSFYLDTSFGKTHILKTGREDAPPLILIHGSNGCAPIALDCYPNLSSTYQVFTLDVLAQPNKSDEKRLSMKDDSYGKWVNEIIDQLGLNQVVLAGFSFGGLIILKTLINNEQKIKEVFLAAPAYIVNGNPLKALFKIFIPMKRYMKTQKKKFVEQFLSVLFTERDPFAVQFLSEVFLHFNMDFTPVPIIDKKEAAQIKTPITILGAAKDIMFPGTKMKQRAHKIFPSLNHFLMLEDSKHVQDQEGNLTFEALMLK